MNNQTTNDDYCDQPENAFPECLIHHSQRQKVAERRTGDNRHRYPSIYGWRQPLALSLSQISHSNCNDQKTLKTLAKTDDKSLKHGNPLESPNKHEQNKHENRFHY